MKQSQIDSFKLDQRIESLIKASVGMTTEEAVKYIEHGREMVEALEISCKGCAFNPTGIDRDRLICPARETCQTDTALAKLEGK